MFCPQCGNDLSKMPDAPVCPTCGQAIAPSQTFASPQVHPGAPLPPWPGTPTQASGWSGTPTAPIASDGTATGAPGTAPAPPLEAYAAPEAPKSRRRLGRALGALGVVIVLALALTIVQGVRGRSAGAASPDDLVKRLQQATVKVDPAAALALLDPDEVPGLGDLYKTAVTQARKGADVDVPGALEAVTISAHDITHTVTYLDAKEQYAKVSFTGGTLSVDTEPKKLPDNVAKRLTDDGKPLTPEHSSTDFKDMATTSTSGKRIDPFLVLVKTKGRWYVSITMTAGEYAVELGDLPGGNFDSTPVAGPPATSPEAAVKTLLDAAKSTANTNKYTGPPLSGLLPDAQTRAFRIYGKSAKSWMQSESGDDSESSGSSTDRPDEYDDLSGSDNLFGLDTDCSDCGVNYSDLSVSVQHRGVSTVAVLDSLKVSYKTQGCDFASDDDEWLNSDGSSGSGSSDGFEDPDSSSGSVDPDSSYDDNDPESSYDDNDSDSDINPDDYCSTKSTETGQAQWDGKCLSWSTKDSPESDVPADLDDDSGKGCLTDKLGDSDLSLADFGVTDVHLVVSQERGGWVIDPVATIMDYGRTALSHLSDPKVKKAINDD